MKKLIIFCVILLMLIIAGCKSVEYIEIDYTLPPEPARQEIILSENITIKECVAIIIYYEYILQEWEAWRDSVKKIILTE